MQNDLYDEGDDKKQQPGFKNRNRPAAHDEPADEKKSFISNQKKRERAEEAGNKYKHLKPVLKFDEGARHILPYASIDVKEQGKRGTSVLFTFFKMVTLLLKKHSNL